MMWTEILMAVVSALLGGGLVSLLTIRGQRKKVNAEADNTAIDGLHEAINLLREEAQRSDDHIERLKKTEDELRERNNDLRDECTVRGTFTCIHMACPLRDPVLGSGNDWFETHSKESNYGADFTPLAELAKKHGYTLIKDEDVINE